MGSRDGTLVVRIIGDDRSFAQTLDGMGSKLSDVASSIPAIAGAGFLAAGAIAGAFLVDGFFEALDRDATADRIAARFALTEDQAARLGAAAAGVYVDAWGGSVAEVSEVIAELQEDIGGLELLPQADVENLATAAIAIQDIFGRDFRQVIDSAGQLIRNGLARDAEEAFDIIARGLQLGAGRSDDFLDTLTEYSEQFQSLGIDAEVATSLIVAGLQEGAFNADKVGDAVKEFSIRAVDGSKATQEAFETIGLDAEVMAQRIVGGGDDAREAMSEIIRALGDVEDKVAQDAAGVGLFGSMWEDLGPQVIAALDPVNNSLGTVGGTIDRITQQAGDNISTRLTGAWREFTNSVPQAILESGLLDAIEDVLDAFDEDGLGGAMHRASELWEEAWPDIERWIDEVAIPAMFEFGKDAAEAFARGFVGAWKDTVFGAIDALGVDPGEFMDLVDPETPVNGGNLNPDPPRVVTDREREQLGGSAMVLNVYNPTSEPTEASVNRELRRIQLMAAS